MRFTDRRFFPSCSECGEICPRGCRKCLDCRKTPFKVSTGRVVNQGRNAVGIALHRPTKGARNKKFYKSEPPISLARMEQMDEQRSLRQAQEAYDQLREDQGSE